jgi:hypothetical protein
MHVGFLRVGDCGTGRLVQVEDTRDEGVRLLHEVEHVIKVPCRWCRVGSRRWVCQ